VIIEKGVEMIGLCENLKKVLPIIETVFGKYAMEPVFVATKWGRDPLRIAHESGHALDIKRHPHNHTKVNADLSDALGLNYTVRTFKDHLHIEYTPLSVFPMSHRIKGAVNVLMHRLRKGC